LLSELFKPCPSLFLSCFPTVLVIPSKTAAMEPFSGDMRSFLDRGSPYSFSSSEYGSRRSYPPSPPLHPVCPGRPRHRSVGPVQNITPPEDEIPSGREQLARVRVVISSPNGCALLLLISLKCPLPLPARATATTWPSPTPPMRTSPEARQNWGGMREYRPGSRHLSTPRSLDNYYVYSRKNTTNA
jgi:hypothetical protein